MAPITGDRAPQRKALIIGVNYAANKEWPELRGQQDATRFKQFLIGEHTCRSCSESADDMTARPSCVGSGRHRAHARSTRAARAPSPYANQHRAFVHHDDRMSLSFIAEEADEAARGRRSRGGLLRILLCAHPLHRLPKLNHLQSPATRGKSRTEATAKKMAWTKVVFSPGLP
jgi:hypothetical protein